MDLGVEFRLTDSEGTIPLETVRIEFCHPLTASGPFGNLSRKVDLKTDLSTTIKTAPGTRTAKVRTIILRIVMAAPTIPIPI